MNSALSKIYEKRKIGRFEKDGIFVSTILVDDCEQAYETAVIHPEFKGGEIIIVAHYSTRGEAEQGHHAWVEKIQGKNLKEILSDDACCLSQLLDNGKIVYERGVL